MCLQHNSSLTLKRGQLAAGWLKVWLCQLNVGPRRLGCCTCWRPSLACSIFLRTRHWNKMSSSGRGGFTKEGGTIDFWEDAAGSESNRAFAANMNKHTAQQQSKTWPVERQKKHSIHLDSAWEESVLIVLHTFFFRYSPTGNERSLLELIYAVWRKESCAPQALRADRYRSITHKFSDGKLTKMFNFQLKNKACQYYSRSAYSLNRSLLALSWRWRISASSASLSDRIW